MSDDNEKPEGLTSGAALEATGGTLTEGALVAAAKTMINQGMTSILKDLYADWGSSYYNVEGAKEELMARIKKLSLCEKVLYGISEDGEHYNE